MHFHSFTLILFMYLHSHNLNLFNPYLCTHVHVISHLTFWQVWYILASLTLFDISHFIEIHLPNALPNFPLLRISSSTIKFKTVNYTTKLVTMHIVANHPDSGGQSRHSSSSPAPVPTSPTKRVRGQEMKAKL